MAPRLRHYKVLVHQEFTTELSVRATSQRDAAERALKFVGGPGGSIIDSQGYDLCPRSGDPRVAVSDVEDETCKSAGCDGDHGGAD